MKIDSFDAPLVTSVPPLTVGDLVGNRYEIDGVAGQGGTAVVFSARHLHLAERYAIKVLRPDFAKDRDLVARFLQEARAAAQLKSDYTCRVFDVGLLPNGIPYMVMELLQGEDLATYLEQTPLVPVEEAVDYVMQACAALSEAHAVGLVHRDIKPENLFLSLEGDGWRSVKLLDFGITRLVDPESIHTGVRNHMRTRDLLGTPKYMSPEQIRDNAATEARSDLWSLGVTLYELLTATAPFQADTVTETLATILETEPRQLSELRPDVPPRLAELVHWCLAKQPELRPSSAAELASELLPYGSRRSRLIVERVKSLARHQGEILRVPLSAPPPPFPAAASVDPEPEPSRRSWGVWAGVAVAVFAAAGIVTWLQTSRAATDQPVATATHDARQAPPQETSPAVGMARPGGVASPPVATASAAAPTAPTAKVARNDPPPRRVPGPLVRPSATAKVAAPPAAAWDSAQGPDMGF